MFSPSNKETGHLFLLKPDPFLSVNYPNQVIMKVMHEVVYVFGRIV
jgi:hypothetical protein